MKMNREVRVLTDPSRRETLSGRDEPRRIVVSLYSQPADGEEGEPNFYHELFAPAHERAMALWGEYGLDAAYFRTLRSSFRNVAHAAPGCRPVIVLSPAMSIDRDFYQFLIEPLVACGHQVVTVGATYETICTVFPDGEVVPHADRVKESNLKDRAWLRQLMQLRTDDLSFVLDALGLFGVGVVGHSLGGAAVFELARRDDRVQGVVLLDASLELCTTDQPMSTPLLNLRQAASPPEFLAAQERLEKCLRSYRSFVRVEDALHISFCDVLAVFHPFVDWPNVHKVNKAVADAVIPFFREFTGSIRGRRAGEPL